jgi:hypothetical protein
VSRQTIVVRDGGLNLPVEARQRPLFVGPCSKGVANTLYWVNGSAALADTLGRGTVVEQAAPVADAGGCLILKTAASTAGTLGTPAVTRVGTSTGTITVANEPADAWRLRVRVATSGTLGAGRFQYALDGYTATDASGWSPIYTIPAGGTFALPQTGQDPAAPVTITFVPGAGPVFFQVGDVHRADCVAPHYTVLDLTNAFENLRTLLGSTRVRRVMFAGGSATASAQIVLAAAVAGHLDNLAAGFRFARAVMDGGSLDTLSNFRTAIASFTDDRIGLVWDPITETSGCRIVSKIPFTGWAVPVVPAVNAVAERFAKTELSESCGRVRSGSLRGVMALGNDDEANPQFEAADRIITLCLVDGYDGFFVKKPFIRSGATSDFRTLQWGTVLDEICEIAHDDLQQWPESNLRSLDDGTGRLEESEAQRVENSVNLKLKNKLIDVDNIEGEKGHVRSARYTVTRNNNYLQDGLIYGFARAVPLREVEGAVTTVGLVSSLSTETT